MTGDTEGEREGEEREEQGGGSACAVGRWGSEEAGAVGGGGL